MLTGILRRLGLALGVMVGVSLLVFLLLHMIPGDPVDVMLGEHARPADQQALRQALGLHLPLHEQLWSFLGGLLQGDLGESLFKQRPVSELLAERFPATLELAFAALSLSVLVALPLGIAAAYHHGGWTDRFASVFALLGLSIPNFWLGPLLILAFSIGLGWTPVSGDTEPLSLVLPALTLGLSLAAITMRMVRASLLEVLARDFIRTARAKGVDERRMLWRHALPNALLPVLTLIGLQFGALLAGAVITEVVFNWPGIGTLLIDAIRQRDYPVVQGCVLLISLTYVLVNALADLMCQLVDPRLGRQ